MNITFSRTWFPAFGGASISTLVFFPLLQVLESDKSGSLFWNSQDTIETLLAWICLWLATSFLLYISKHNNRLSYLTNAFMLLIGGFFLAGALIRMDSIALFLINNQSFFYRYGSIFALILVICLVWTAINNPLKYNNILINILIFLSPISLLMIANLLDAQLKGGRNISILDNPLIESSAAPLSTGAHEKLIVILLFDELSVDFLYGKKEALTNNFPALSRVLKNSTKFKNAYLPGGETALAIPSLFSYKRNGVSLKNFIEKNSGQISINGWHINYCPTAGAPLDTCQSISSYNPRTLNRGFSLLNPIWANINVLPYAKPFGYLKIPLSTLLHEMTVSLQTSRTMQALGNSKNKLIYTHFNIPHAPVIDNKNISIYDSGRFDLSEKNYISQFKKIDEVLAKIENEVNLIREKRKVNLILLSDHNARGLTPKSEHTHVVLVTSPPEKNIDNVRSLKLDAKKINPAEVILQLIEN